MPPRITAETRRERKGVPTGRAEPVGGETSQTLDRGLAVLLLLADRDHAAGMTITQLAADLRVGRPVVYRLVATLEARGFATRCSDGRIRLGLAVARLAAAVHPLLREVALPVLRELADTAGATAHLSLVEAGQVLAVAVVEPTWTDFHVAYRVGSRHRLDQGAAGRAILAGREGRTGYVTSVSELQAGAYGVAAPVLPAVGRPAEVEASVGVVALAELDLAAVGPQVVRAAGAVGALIG